MGKKKDIVIGNVYGCLKVIGLDEEKTRLNRERKLRGEITSAQNMWVCECVNCGRITTQSSGNLNTLLKNGKNGCACSAKAVERNKNTELIYNNDLNCCELQFKSNGKKILFDTDKLDLVESRSWSVTDHDYVYANTWKRERLNKRNIALHRYLFYNGDMEKVLDRRYVVDHINRDRLDCRNNNLRECTFAENSRNKSVYKNRSDGFTGVYHNGKKYIPTVRLNGELKKFGAYDTLEEAVDVRIKAANELFGEFSPYKS